MEAGTLKINFAVIFFVVSVRVTQPQSQGPCLTPRQVTAECVPIRTCKPISQLLLSAPRPLPESIIQSVRQLHCGTFNNLPYVCCEQSESPVQVETQSTTPRFSTDTISSNNGAVATRASYEVSDSDIVSGMSILETFNCGEFDEDRIANGEDTNLSEFPWMALLVYSNGVKTTLDCGGSLITDRYVLTAAHCIRVTRTKLVRVRLGEHDTKTDIDCVGRGRGMMCAPALQEIDIEEAVYHMEYNPVKFSNDIGLIRLATKAVFRSNVKPICLPITPISRQNIEKIMFIAGWGLIESGLKASVLQKAPIPVKDNDFCQQIHTVVPITENHLCAGGENDTDSCKGDSGGPLFNKARYRLGARYVQYGVVSGGSNKCGANFPTIFSKVISYVSWIAGNIRP